MASFRALEFHQLLNNASQAARCLSEISMTCFSTNPAVSYEPALAVLLKLSNSNFDLQFDLQEPIYDAVDVENHE